MNLALRGANPQNSNKCGKANASAYGELANVVAASLVTSLVYVRFLWCLLVFHSAVRPSPLCQQTGALCGTWGEFITLGTLYNDMGIDWMEINDWLPGDQRAPAAGRGQISALTPLWSWFWSLLGPGDLGPDTRLISGYRACVGSPEYSHIWGGKCNNGPHELRSNKYGTQCLSLIS